MVFKFIRNIFQTPRNPSEVPSRYPGNPPEIIPLDPSPGAPNPQEVPSPPPGGPRRPEEVPEVGGENTIRYLPLSAHTLTTLLCFQIGTYGLGNMDPLPNSQQENSVSSQQNSLKDSAAELEVNLSFWTNKKAEVTFQVPTKLAYGFEGESQTPEQTALTDTVVDKAKQNIEHIIAVDPALFCKYTVEDVDKFSNKRQWYQKNTKSEKQRIHTTYQVLKVKFTLNCEKDLPQKKLTVNFQEPFQNIQKILVQVDTKWKRRFVINGSQGSFTM